MMVIHKTWCGACKALKPKFAESKGIEELSRNFVMINVEDDEEPQDTKFQIDGSYIPRIYILDSAGRVQEDIYNKNGNPSYKYYYGNERGIVSSMKEALEKMIDGVRIGDELWEISINYLGRKIASKNEGFLTSVLLSKLYFTY